MSDQFEQVTLWRCRSCGQRVQDVTDACCGLWPDSPATFTRTDDLVEALDNIATNWECGAEDIGNQIDALISKLKGGEDG